MKYLLDELARWFAVCGEAIHGTKPWRKYGEGDSRVLIQGFKEEKVAWSGSDYRFTARGDTLYAFMLASPREPRLAVIKSLVRSEQVGKVTLLGFGECKFSQAFGTLTVEFPDRLPSKYVNALAIGM